MNPSWKLSNSNIVSQIDHSDNYFIVNLLTGNADIMTEEEFTALTKIEPRQEFISKGYITTAEIERQLTITQYLNFIDSRATDEIQIFFVPWYDCNFACQYCYQENYNASFESPDNDIIQSFFSYILKKFVQKEKYLTIFGGEPLLSGKKYRNFIEHFLDLAKKNELETAIVTNGFYLKDYVELFKNSKIREIQVTLDGIEETHNKRRPLKGGQGTFNQIVEGIQACLDAAIPINLRFVADRENINELHNLAKFCIEKNWINSPFFKTQIGRNYELHHCQEKNERLFDRLSLWRKIYELIAQYPEIEKYHQPAFSISKYLYENGNLPQPLFDSCPGCKSEWAFDGSGKIYSCTATVGKKGEELGTFWPKVELDHSTIEKWQDRDVESIEDCKVCNLKLACGGGCASIAKNRTGKINSTDCRPIKELLEMGMNFYFQQRS